MRYSSILFISLVCYRLSICVAKHGQLCYQTNYAPHTQTVYEGGVRLHLTSEVKRKRDQMTDFHDIMFVG